MSKINGLEKTIEIINIYKIIVLSIIIYIVLFFTVGCKFIKVNFVHHDSLWRSEILISALSIFGLKIYLSITKISDIRSFDIKEKMAIILTSLVLYFISFVTYGAIYFKISPILTKSKLSFPSIFWIDWIVSGPLIAFFATCSNYQVKFSYQQIIYMVSICLMYSTALLAHNCNYTCNHIFSAIFMILIVLVIFESLLFFNQSKVKEGSIVPSSFQVYEQKNEELEWKTIRFNVNRILIYICVPLLIIYVLELCNVFSDYNVYVGYTIIFKVVTIHSITNSQLELIDTIRGRINSHIQANIARKSFMKYVFHEIRNPLNSLTLGLNVVNSSRKLTSLERETLDTMEESVLFMSNTLNDILSMHSIEDGAFQLISKEFNLKEALFNSILPLKSIAEDKNIEVSVDLTYMVPRAVIGDRIRIGLVISNFLSYILKYSDNNKHILIVVSLVEDVIISSHTNNKKSTDKSNVLFVFEDEGPGIPEDVLISFLQPFVQLRNDEVSLGVTNGLGLALARDIIEMHGGSLFITKRPNQSMRLGFSIPFNVLSKDVSAGELVKCIHRKRIHSQLLLSEMCSYSKRNNPEEKSLIISNRNSTIKSPTGKLDQKEDSLSVSIRSTIINSPARMLGQTDNYHVSSKFQAIDLKNTIESEKKIFLVVDDALSNRKILTMSLKKLNIDADSAENGQIAVDMIRNQLDKYTSIFMDYTMPIMDGAESTKLIRELGYNQLIFGLTGNALYEDMKLMSDAGVDIVLTKPLHPALLSNIIAYLDKNGSESKPNTKLILNGNDIEMIE